jgi:hypothetical protein
MSSAEKGRCVAIAVVGATLAWGDSIALAAFLIGIPYGLLAGTIVGRLAGRLERRRGLVIAAALAWALFGDLVVATAIALSRGMYKPSLPMLFVVSLVPTIVGAVMLERWTRPADRVPHARAI